jgi:hypothetical protein
MTSNMEYRLLLTQQADTIIANNQNIAFGNCSNIIIKPTKKLLIHNPYIISNPTDQHLPYDNSDLKDEYLKNYIYCANKYTPVIKINKY